MDNRSLGWPRFRLLTYLMLFAVVASGAATSYAQVARMEIHSFQAMTLTDQEFLIGRKEGKPVTFAGELRLPRPGIDRLPAVVLLLGSHGAVVLKVD